MKIDDRIIELAIKKMLGEACVEELQELNNLLQDDVDVQKALKTLLEEWTYEDKVSEDRSRLLFEKIKARIEYKT
ncbi:MAG: hypothetical protein V4577_13825 [Bacteroidota bacterium]